MVKITGATRHANRLSGIRGARAAEAVGRAIYVASDLLRVEASRSIVHGAIQGKGHIPSKPGEPPNRDTGQLDTSIINRRVAVLRSETVSQAPYSLPLEIGSSKMEERPFMRPAAKKTRPIAVKLVKTALSKVLSSS